MDGFVARAPRNDGETGSPLFLRALSKSPKLNDATGGFARSECDERHIESAGADVVDWLAPRSSPELRASLAPRWSSLARGLFSFNQELRLRF
jgi:hypothetical protein